jgi:hypothetical protein
MPLFRRSLPLPPAFLEAAAHLDAAQRALLSAIPTSRHAGAPLAEALARFSACLTETEAAIERWKDEPSKAACRRAVHASRAEAERLRLHPGALEFEALNARVGDVLHHLEVFADVERALRRA